MNVDQLKKDLIQDEGIKLEIYEDHLGLPTHGIGHLITEWDEEYGNGLIQADAALAWTAGPVDNPPSVTITSPVDGVVVEGVVSVS